ncbi:hypothetical protein TREES_T100001589 [Tupaia chinensis]|uniref:Uncharacterized protein n=1 Tax=Tupaia chinensis TaxID=246437 RepID=L9KJV9_TUPCH|nr:hypothetical protein TREES_T100001589 [Tupaia chinensis]
MPGPPLAFRELAPSADLSGTMPCVELRQSCTWGYLHLQRFGEQEPALSTHLGPVEALPLLHAGCPYRRESAHESDRCCFVNPVGRSPTSTWKYHGCASTNTTRARRLELGKLCAPGNAVGCLRGLEEALCDQMALLPQTSPDSDASTLALQDRDQIDVAGDPCSLKENSPIVLSPIF